MGTTYGGRNYHIKYPVGSSTYVDIRDLCPVYKDLSSSTLSSRFKGPGNASIKGTLKKDDWNEGYTLPFIKTGSSAEEWIVRGTAPQGKNCVAVITPDYWYPTMEDAQNKDNKSYTGHAVEKDFLRCKLLRTSEKLYLLKYNDEQQDWNYYTLREKDWFKDGVVPKRLLIVMGGGGGRGANKIVFGAESGGASGATVAFILNIQDMPSNLEFRIGRGASRTGDSYSVSNGVNTTVGAWFFVNGTYGYHNVAIAGGGESSTSSPFYKGKPGEGNILSDSFSNFDEILWKVPATLTLNDVTSHYFTTEFSGYLGGGGQTSVSPETHPESIIITSWYVGWPDRFNFNSLYSEKREISYTMAGGPSMFSLGGLPDGSVENRSGNLGSGGAAGDAKAYGGRGGDGYVAIYY